MNVGEHDLLRLSLAKLHRLQGHMHGRICAAGGGQGRWRCAKARQAEISCSGLAGCHARSMQKASCWRARPAKGDRTQTLFSLATEEKSYRPAACHFRESAARLVAKSKQAGRRRPVPRCSLQWNRPTGTRRTAARAGDDERTSSRPARRCRAQRARPPRTIASRRACILRPQSTRHVRDRGARPDPDRQRQRVSSAPAYLGRVLAAAPGKHLGDRARSAAS